MRRSPPPTVFALVYYHYNSKWSRFSHLSEAIRHSLCRSSVNLEIEKERDDIDAPSFAALHITMARISPTATERDDDKAQIALEIRLFQSLAPHTYVAGIYLFSNMVFLPPPAFPSLPYDPPRSITVEDFMIEEKWGRPPLHSSRPPFTCGLTGREYQAAEITNRVDFLSRALSRELSWKPTHGTEWDKVIGVFTLNTVSFPIESIVRKRLRIDRLIS